MAKVNRKDSKGRVLHDYEYERKNGTYEYRPDRKSGEKSFYAKTLTELRVLEKERVINAGNKIRADVNKITINNLYDKWIKVKRGIKDNTFQNYKYMYCHFVMPDFGKTKICELKKSDIRDFYIKLIETNGVDISSVDTVHNVLHQVLQLGVDDDYLRKNPADNAFTEIKKARNIDTEKERALSVNEQQIFENYLKNTNKYFRWYPIFVVMLYTGMRVGEVTGLRWQDIDFENNDINVNHTLVYYSRGKEKGCTFAVNTPKTKSGRRMIPMLPIVKNALMMEKQYQEELEITSRATIDGYSDFVFINRFGDTQHQGTLNKALKRIIRDCNFQILDSFKSNSKEYAEPELLPNFSTHSLRHTFATRLCEADVNIKVIQNVMGHSDIKTTMNIYTEAKRDFKHNQINNLSEYLSKLDLNETSGGFTNNVTNDLPTF